MNALVPKEKTTLYDIYCSGSKFKAAEHVHLKYLPTWFFLLSLIDAVAVEVAVCAKFYANSYGNIFKKCM